MADQADLDLDMQLMAAAEALDLTLAKQLLEKGADAKFIHDPPGIWGSCSKKGPLHMAIKMQPRKTKALLESEFQLKLEDWKELVKLLVEAGADVNGKTVDYNWREWTPFEKILPSAMEDPALLQLFLSAGANPNTKHVKHEYCNGIDSQAVSFVIYDAVRTRSLKIVSTLLAARADVDAVSWRQLSNARAGIKSIEAETALHQASSLTGAEGLAMCSLLLAHGAQVNILREEEGYFKVSNMSVQETALHIAIASKNAELVARLVCAGADTSCSRLQAREAASGALVWSSARMTKLSSCVELCEGNEALLQALALEPKWCPQMHRHFSSEIQAQVEATLMAATRQKWPLDAALLHLIFDFISRPVVVQSTQRSALMREP
mmetsp:Transcript_48336/g.105170  ORF Transcript_48336/g.105170 Transcript_48336/m.105170 type:complete len:379 (+) Transcript_48336:134-1270(+)